MRAFVLVLGASLLAMSGTSLSAADAKFERSLKMLDPSARLEQLCDYTAMTQIRATDKNFRPDRAIANAMTEPVVSADTVEAKGGAFRSRGKWYALTYRCQATPDHMAVISFNFTIGAEIPETKWAAFGLWD
ncbi:MAG: DUF930 domain-containing protein [Pseudolabrys sp.]